MRLETTLICPKCEREITIKSKHGVFGLPLKVTCKCKEIVEFPRDEKYNSRIEW